VTTTTPNEAIEKRFNEMIESGKHSNKDITTFIERWMVRMRRKGRSHSLKKTNMVLSTFILKHG
jgi:hypothetical protein